MLLWDGGASGFGEATLTGERGCPGYQLANRLLKQLVIPSAKISHLGNTSVISTQRHGFLVGYAYYG